VEWHTYDFLLNNYLEISFKNRVVSKNQEICSGLLKFFNSLNMHKSIMGLPYSVDISWSFGLKVVLSMSVQWVNYSTRSQGLLGCDVIQCEDGGSMDLWNTGILLQHCTVSQPRRPKLESSLPWNPQNVTSTTLHTAWQRGSWVDSFIHTGLLDSLSVYKTILDKTAFLSYNFMRGNFQCSFLSHAGETM